MKPAIYSIYISVSAAQLHWSLNYLFKPQCSSFPETEKAEDIIKATKCINQVYLKDHGHQDIDSEGSKHIHQPNGQTCSRKQYQQQQQLNLSPKTICISPFIELNSVL